MASFLYAGNLRSGMKKKRKERPVEVPANVLNFIKKRQRVSYEKIFSMVSACK